MKTLKKLALAILELCVRLVCAYEYVRCCVRARRRLHEDKEHGCDRCCVCQHFNRSTCPFEQNSGYEMTMPSHKLSAWICERFGHQWHCYRCDAENGSEDFDCLRCGAGMHNQF